MDEQMWVDLARQGDLEAFNRLVLSLQGHVYAQACWLVGERQAAEDLTQEAFLIAFWKLGTFRGGSFRAWLLRIVTNLCLDELRSRKRSPVVPLEPLSADGEANESPSWLADPGDSPEKALELAELRETVRGCLNRLPPVYRAAVVLVDLQGLDYTEAAAVLRVSIGTVKSRLARGRMRIRAAWLQSHGSPGESLLIGLTGVRSGAIPQRG